VTLPTGRLSPQSKLHHELTAAAAALDDLELIDLNRLYAGS
jgi:hypothetical protein